MRVDEHKIVQKKKRKKTRKESQLKERETTKADFITHRTHMAERQTINVTTHGVVRPGPRRQEVVQSVLLRYQIHINDQVLLSV